MKFLVEVVKQRLLRLVSLGPADLQLAPLHYRSLFKERYTCPFGSLHVMRMCLKRHFSECIDIFGKKSKKKIRARRVRALQSRYGFQLPPNEGIQLPPNEDIQLPPNEDIQLPPNEGIQLPPNEDIQLPPNEGIQLPPDEGIQPPPNKKVSNPTYNLLESLFANSLFFKLDYCSVTLLVMQFINTSLSQTMQPRTGPTFEVTELLPCI